MEKSKVYVHLIDGGDTWAPINAKHIIGNRFEIMEDEEYDSLDSSILFEFYPGDIVEVVDSE